jgi:SAM-dependent methyltransferase
MEKNFATRYGDLEKWHWWFRGRRKILDAVLKQEFGDDQSAVILSVGCGPAEGLNWLVPYCGNAGKVVGLDIEVVHAQPAPANVEFVVGSLEDTSLPERSFDLVLALDVLEHLNDDLAGLKKIRSLIKPGGLLLITVPALPSLWGGQDVVSHHHRRYTRRSLAALMANGDLKNCRVTYFNSILFPAVASLRWSRRLLGLKDRARSDFEDGKPGPVNNLLAWLFGLESSLVNLTSMPIGVSLLATCRIPAHD